MSTVTTNASPHLHRCPTCNAPIRTIRGDRRFVLLDAMMLVAATAFAFTSLRGSQGGKSSKPIGPRPITAAISEVWKTFLLENP